MIVATTDESHGKSNQATFLKVAQNLYRNVSSDTYYGLTKRGGKQFRIAPRMENGVPAQRPHARQANAKFRRHSPEVLHSQISEAYCFAVFVILDADVATQAAGGGVGPGCHDAFVNADGVVVAGADHFKSVP